MTFVKSNNPLTKSFDGLMNEIFNGLPVNPAKSFKENTMEFPPVNIVEKTELYQLDLSAPGFEKTDFNLKLEGNLLTISAEKKEEVANETAKTIRKEFNFKSFKRSFTVDDKIEASNINAKYENGILKVMLPKKEEVKVATKEITIQ